MQMATPIQIHTPTFLSRIKHKISEIIHLINAKRLKQLTEIAKIFWEKFEFQIEV